MSLESEKRYYLGWGFAFIGLAIGIFLQSMYSDLSMSTGIFLVVVGIGLAIVAFIPKYEALTLGSGAVFVAAGALLLLSRYAGGNMMYGLALLVAIIGFVLLVTGLKKEW